MKLQNDADKRLHEINDHGYQECQFSGLLYCSARALEDHLILQGYNRIPTNTKEKNKKRKKVKTLPLRKTNLCVKSVKHA